METQTHPEDCWPADTDNNDQVMIEETMGPPIRLGNTESTTFNSKKKLQERWGVVGYMNA